MNATAQGESQIGQHIFDQARLIVNGQRKSDYGRPENCFGTISSYWSKYLGIEVEPHDVAMMMILLKVARSNARPTEDTLIDIAGYAGIAHHLTQSP